MIRNNTKVWIHLISTNIAHFQENNKSKAFLNSHISRWDFHVNSFSLVKSGIIKRYGGIRNELMQ